MPSRFVGQVETDKWKNPASEGEDRNRIPILKRKPIEWYIYQRGSCMTPPKGVFPRERPRKDQLMP